MNKGISVIICCYNSAERLPKTLKHLAQQQVPADIKWEIIVIDNASTDNTAQVASREWENYALSTSFKMLHQPIQGKNYAFEKGINEAQYSYILTCDDDNWLHENYISTAYNIINSDPSIGALGGCGIFEPEQPFNEAISNYKIDYVNGTQSWAASQHWVYGAGAIYKKSILDTLRTNGWQQITPGRLGKKLICGEDVEFCLMFYLMGYKIIADDRLLFKHFVPLKRQDINYIINLKYWAAYTNVLLNSYYILVNTDVRPFKVIINKWFWASLKTLIKQSLILLYQSITTFKPLSISQKISYAGTRGTFWALLNDREKVIEHHYHTKNLLAAYKLTKPILQTIES